MTPEGLLEGHLSRFRNLLQGGAGYPARATDHRAIATLPISRLPVRAGKVRLGA
jgi:hypothetical protein